MTFRNRLTGRARQLIQREVLQEFTITEDFDGRPDDTPIQNDPRWSNGPGDTSNGTTVKAVYFGDRGYFKDNVNGLLFEKDYLFPSASSGSGISKIKMDIEIQQELSTSFSVIISDGVNVAVWFLIITQLGDLKATIVEPVLTTRTLQKDGADIDPLGTHSWQFWLDETNEEVRVFFDSVEVFAVTGFDSYYQAAGAIAGLRFASENVADNVEAYVDNIGVSW
jgi:hypothetical protein